MNSWETTRRDVSALCQELWADAGHGHESSNHDLITKIAEVRAAIHRSAEETRQPWGAVVTLHGDIDKAAAAWSERGSEWHRVRAAASVAE